MAGQLITALSSTHSATVIKTILKDTWFWVVSVVVTAFLAAAFEGLSFSMLLMGFLSFTDTSIQAQLNQFIAKHLAFWPELVSYITPDVTFLALIVGAIGLQLLRAVCTYLSTHASVLVSAYGVVYSRKRVFKQIFEMTFASVSRYKVGELIEICYIPTRTIAYFISQLFLLVMSVLISLSYVVLLLLISVKLTLFAASLILPSLILYKLVSKKIRAHSLAVTQSNVAISRRVVDSLGALKMIHSFGNQNQVMKSVDKLLEASGVLQKKESLLSAVVSPAMETVMLVALGIFVAFSRFFLSSVDPLASSAQVVTFVLVLYRLSTRIQGMVSCLSLIGSVTGPLESLDSLLETKNKTFTRKSGVPFEGFKNKIRFSDVELRYESEDTPALSQITFEMEKGSTTAFVGSSGGGKTSLVDLLLGLYSPTRGEISIDGVSLEKLDLSLWRHAIGSVGQDPVLLNESIMANLQFAAPTATLEQIRESARLAQIDDFLMSLPEQYETVVGERGLRLSGGQRQRIALARALVRNPEILILDEATSALDSESESLVQDALRLFKTSKTILIVAHRLSTIQHADQIIVLDKGKILEQGTHQSLIQLKGRYWSLWQQQLMHKEQEPMGEKCLD